MDKTKLTKNKRDEALSCLMFLKKKRNGDIKGRACGDKKTAGDNKKKDAAPPTVAT